MTPEMTGTCQVFDHATRLLVYADGPAMRSRPLGPDDLRSYVVIRYVHRTLPPRMMVMSFQLTDFLAYRIEKQPLLDVLGYLSTNEQEFLRSGLLEEEFMFDA